MHGAPLDYLIRQLDSTHSLASLVLPGFFPFYRDIQQGFQKLEHGV